MHWTPLTVVSGVALGVAQAAVAVEALPGMDEYTITYWWGPRAEETTPARYDEIVAAGFTLACPPVSSEPGQYHPYFSKEQNLRILAECERTGIKAIIADERMIEAYWREEGWEELVTSIVADYRAHPALGGYYIIDEPNADAFPKLGAIQALLRQADPEHYGYINLFPNYASPEMLKAKDYRNYVERYVAEVKPPFICYDNYHLLDPDIVRGDAAFASEEERRIYDIAHATGPREALFLENLDIVGDAATRHDLPFMAIVLLVPHGPYRQPTEAELRWEAFHCLANGASGVSYFSYWSPPYEDTWKFRDSAFSFAGERTELYDTVAKVNRDLKTYGNALLGKALLQALSLSSEQPAFDVSGAGRIAGGPATVGVFEDGYILAANRGYHDAATVTLALGKGRQAFRVSPETGQEQTLTTGEVVLAPGDAVLIRVAPR